MRMHSFHLGLGDCIPGQPSTDPNCFTTPAYIRALNLKQVSGEQAAGLISSSIDSAGCYDTYMTQGPNFNPDAYNRCIGAQDVTTPQFNAAARAGVSFAQNPYVPPITQAQVKTLSTAPPAGGGTAPSPPPGSGGSGGGGGTGGGGTGGSSATPPFDLIAWLKSPLSSTLEIPKWLAGAAVGLGLFVYSRYR
jgi:hypothetical protein